MRSEWLRMMRESIGWVLVEGVGEEIDVEETGGGS